MSRRAVPTPSSERLRYGPWRADRSRAYLSPIAGQEAPRALDIVRCIDDLRRQGYSSAVTTALSRLDQIPFLGAGFRVHEELHLLELDLTTSECSSRMPLIGTTDVRIVRGRWWHVGAALQIDRLGFDDDWSFDRSGFQQSRRATPVSQFLVGRAPGIAGYSISGRAGRQVYLQRLAVDPSQQGRGIGRRLVEATIAWGRRRGSRSVLVNTQQANEPALHLYESLGFVRRPEQLGVLHWIDPNDSTRHVP